jgi:integrase
MSEAKKRRDYGDGSLYFRDSDNRWVGSFYHDGERKYVYGSVGGKKEEARQKLKAAMKQAEAGTLVASNKQTVATFLGYWLSVKKLPLKPGAYATYASYVNVHMVPHLGRIQLQKLTRHHVQRFVNALFDEEDLEPGTIQTAYTILNVAMSDAVEWQMLAANPCKAVSLPRVESRDYTVLNREQAQALIAFLDGHALEALVTVALATGMRRGELLCLKWSDVDLERGHMYIQRSLTFINGQGYKEVTPKTKSSKRHITLPRFALETLKRHRTAQVKVRLESATWTDPDLVFPTKTGKYIPTSTLQREFRLILERAELPPMRFHDLRHTCATLLLSQGISPKVVQELLGHSSIKITMDRYGHVIPGMQETAMIAYDTLFTLNDIKEKANLV